MGKIRAPLWHELSPRLIAILRGISPEETSNVVSTLVEVGFRAIEIPLNSPDAIVSVRIACGAASDTTDEPCLVGAGTVLRVEEVEQVCVAGGNLIVSPNKNVNIIRRSLEHGAISLPGVFTPTECFEAINAGATALKIFPANIIGIAGISALRPVLPENISLCAVGGITSNDFSSYLDAGADSFALGGSLYRPGDTPDAVRVRAIDAIEQLRQAG